MASQPSLSYAAVPLAGQPLSAAPGSDDGADDPILDPSCSCCFSRRRRNSGVFTPEAAASTSVPGCCSLLSVLVLFAGITFCFAAGCVIYSINLLSGLLSLCPTLRAAFIAVPTVAAFLWILGTYLLFRVYKARRRRVEEAMVREKLLQENFVYQNAPPQCCTGRKCAVRLKSPNSRNSKPGRRSQSSVWVSSSLFF
jgi:hypothetical protein